MPEQPHPFEQQPSDHPGWCRRHFELDNRQWALLTIDDGIKLSSMVWPLATYQNEPWPHFHKLSLDCVITVDAAVAIIKAVYAAYDKGISDGAARKAADLRRMLGVVQ